MTTRHIIYGHKSNRLNNYAITSADLATSLTKSVAALRTAGNSLEQVEALEVAGNAILQDADVVSNSLKVLSLRLRGTTGSALEEIGEDTEGLIEDFSKLNGKIQALTKTASNPEGISIIDKQTKAYKSTYQILLEISKVWKDMGDMQQAELLEIVAGKTRASAAAGILSSPDILQQAYEDAILNSTGAGQKALETATESIEFKTNQIKDNFASIAREIFDAQGVKGVLDTVVDFSNELLKNTSGFQTLITAVETLLNLIIKVVANIPPEGIIGAIIGIKNRKGSWGNNIATNLFNKINTGIFKLPINTSDVIQFKNYFSLIESGTEELDAWNLTMAKTSKTSQELAGDLIRQGVSSEQATVAMAAQVKTSKALTIATGALNAAISVGITLLATWAISAISEAIHAEDTLKQNAKDIANQYNEFANSIDSYKTKIQSLHDVINDENTDIQNAIQAKSDLYDIQQQLLSQFSGTAEGYDIVIRAINGEIDALNELSKAQWKTQLNNFNKDNEGNSGFLDKIFSNMKNGTGASALLGFLGQDLVTSGKTPAQLVYERWLEGDTDYEDFAKQYFQFEVLEKVYSRQYNQLLNLEKEYEKKIRSGEFTVDDKKYFAEAYTKILGDLPLELYQSGAYEKLKNDIFANLTLNQIDYDKILETQKEEQKKIQSGINKLWDDLWKSSDMFNPKSVFDNGEKIQIWDQAHIVKLKEKFDALGIDTWEEIEAVKDLIKEATEEGITDINKLFDLYEERLNKLPDDNKVIEQTYASWLKQASKLTSDSEKGGYYSHTGLIGAYKDNISNYQQILQDFEKGATKVNFGQLTDDLNNNEFFEQLGMDSFEYYIKGFSEDSDILKTLSEEDAKKYIEGFGETSDALGAYLKDVMKEVLGNMDLGSLSTDAFGLFESELFGINADLFSISENVLKIEDNYWELRKVQDKVKDGFEFTAEEAGALMTKYEELASGVAEKFEEVDEKTGQITVKYKFQENAVDSLVNSYATMSNEAISSLNRLDLYAEETVGWLQQMELEILQMTLDAMNFGTSAATLIELYNKRDSSLHNAISFLSEEDQGKINKLISDTSARINEVQISSRKRFKVTDDDGTGITGGGSGDKDNKSRYDWLDSYLEKRNRNLQKEQTAYENLGKQIVKTGDIETQYTETQNKSLEEQNRLLDEQIAAYKTAEEEYGRRMKGGLLYNDLVSAFDSKAEANKIVKRIENREDINLAEYTSEQQSAITAMMDNYNKKLDAADKQLEAQNQKRENSLQMFTNNIELITKKFDHVLNEFANRQEQLEHYQTMRTNAGFMENQKYYIALLDNESRELNANIEKRQTLIDTLKELKVETADDLAKWWETKDAIDATTKAIYENEEAIESYKMSMKQLSWDLNDRIRNITGNLRNETEFLMDTLSTFDADMYDYSREYLGNDAEKTKIYSGKMSDVGLSTMAMRRVRMESFMEDIQALNDEIDQVEQEYLEDTANTTILDRLTTLREAQQDLIKSYNQEREAIVSLVDDGYQKQLQSLEAITSKTMEMLNAEKSLYDYQKGLAKQTKNIANIRKMMTAYEGDLSQESRSKLQQLQVQLEEAEEERNDTMYSRQLEDQQRIFDWLYQKLSDTFADIMSDPSKVVDDTKQLVNDNMPKIKDTLSKSLDIYQTDISQSLKNILSDEGIGAVNSNIAAVDGDIRGITASVTQQTAELERYLAENEIGLPPEETLQDRINKLYGEESTAGSFANYFRSFNDKLTEINNSISKIDLTSKLEDAGKNLADSSSNILDKYLGNKNTVSGSVGTTTSIATGVATGIVKGLGKGTSVGNTTSLSSTSIASSIISAVKKKYASGVKRLSSGELAWTQEDGLEAILRPTDNAILTPLKAGDSVLTAEATQNLWNFANNPLAFMKSTVGVPNSISKNNGVTFNNAMSPTIIVNGVSNANEFIRELQKNKQFESMMQDMTVNLMNGGASLSKLKYKF